jgi:hypothetical protein
MRKIIYFIILLLLSQTMVFSAATSTDNLVDSETLILVLPGDTLTVGFAADSKKTAFTESTRKLALNKYTEWSDSSDDIDIENIADKNSKSYATAALEFYVYWDAFVSKDSKVVLTVPSSFKSTTTDDELSVVSDSNKISRSSTTVSILGTKTEEEVASFSASKISIGSKAYIIAVDISKAKPGLTYKGTLTLQVVAS